MLLEAANHRKNNGQKKKDKGQRTKDELYKKSTQKTFVSTLLYALLDIWSFQNNLKKHHNIYNDFLYITLS